MLCFGTSGRGVHFLFGGRTRKLDPPGDALRHRILYAVASVPIGAPAGIPLEEHCLGHSTNVFRHSGSIGGAAVSGWHLRDRARSRPSWTSPCRRRRMRGKADHPRPLDRRHRAEWKRRCMGCRCLRGLLSGTKDALPEQVVRGYWRGALLFALGIHGQYVLSTVETSS